MGKIVLSEFVSLDGVMEAPGGEPGYKHTGWVATFADTGQFAYKLDEVLAHEALLLGRRTYEGFAAAWPARLPARQSRRRRRLLDLVGRSRWRGRSCDALWSGERDGRPPRGCS